MSVRKHAKNLVAAKYWRLPKKIIGNELYIIKTLFDSIYSSLEHGNDFKPEQFDELIKELGHIKTKAKSFEKGEKPPEGF